MKSSNFDTAVILLFASAVGPALSQVISASFSLLGGSTLSGQSAPSPNYPPSIGMSGRNYYPGARNGHATIVYKGLLYSFCGDPRPAKDVWSFNATDKYWVLVAGYSNMYDGFYGMQGVASVSNTPGSRNNFGWGFNSEIGKFFLFSGQAMFGYPDDLWTFNLADNMWTWITGTNNAAATVQTRYSALGVESSLATPGSRLATACIFSPATGEFLLFLGQATVNTFYGDVWSFSLSTSRWAWISATSSTSATGFFGPKGQWSTSYFPTRRSFHRLVRDPYSNIIYLFGGQRGALLLNDFWGFKPDTRQWAWIGGSSASTSQLGIFGTMGLPGAANAPSGRHGHTMAFHEKSGLILLFGGLGIPNTAPYGLLADLWAYNVTSNQWTWISGSSAHDVPGNYTAGFEYPPSQYGGAMAVDQETGSILLFGGSGFIVAAQQRNSDLIWSVDISSPSPTRSLISSGFSSLTSNAASLASSQISRKSSYTPSLNYVSNLMSSGVQQIISTFTDASYFEVQSTFGPDTIAQSPVDCSLIALSQSCPSLDNQSTTSSEALDIPSSPFVVYVSIGIAVICIIIGTAVVISFIQKRIKKPDMTTEVSSTYSSHTTIYAAPSSTFSTAYSVSQTTMASTAMGLYLPGNLQVEATAFRKDQEIARGGSGSIWLATALTPNLMTHGSQVIVKMSVSTRINERSISLFYQEIAIINAFRNRPNFVNVLGYSENPYAIILKYYPRGSLANWLVSGNRPLRQAHSFVKDVSVGVSALHDNGIVHCDLKPDNILIDEGTKLVAILADFGIARIVTDKLLQVLAYQVQEIKGASIRYAAPEVLRELNKNESSNGKSSNNIMARDTYSLGIIVNALLNGRPEW